MLGSWIPAVFAIALAATDTPEAPTDADIARGAREALAQATRADGPGAVLVIQRGDRTILRTARGKADLELDVALDPRHVLAIASVTKTYTAALVVELARDGRVALDDPLAKHLPDFPNAQRITLRQLLQHTAGVSDVVPAPQPGFSRRDIDTALHLSEIAKRPLDFEPGTRWRYSNAGYIVLGAAIERATDASWHATLRKELLAPHGLDSTRYGASRALLAGRIRGYTRSRNGKTVHPPPISLSMPAAAGALVSSADDLVRFMRLLAAGELVGADGYAQMSAPSAVAPAAPADYGYGFGLYLWRVRGTAVVGHTGQINGFTSALAHVPEHDLTLAVLANDDRFDARTLLKRVVGVAVGRPFPVVDAVPVPRDVLAELPGAYGDGNDALRIEADGERLQLRREGRDPLPLQWTAEGRLHFVPDELAYFTLERDASERVAGLAYYRSGEGAPLHLDRRGN